MKIIFPLVSTVILLHLPLLKKSWDRVFFFPLPKFINDILLENTKPELHNFGRLCLHKDSKASALMVLTGDKLICLCLP